MKFFIVLALFFATTVAHAEDTLVFEYEGEFQAAALVEQAFFTYSSKRGTARITVNAEGFDDCLPGDVMRPCFPPTYQQRLDVEGLYFDKTIGKRGAVMYDSGDETVICAYKRRFRGPKSTGLCNIDLERVGIRGYIVRLFVDL